MLLKCLENQHKWKRTNNIAKIYAGLEIKKKFQVAFWQLSKKKNGCQIQKCSCQIVQEQKLRLDPHLIEIVVWLLELNMFQRHPLVAAAWDSCPEQMFLKGFETLLVCILTTPCFLVISSLQQITKIAQCIFLLW